MRVSKNRFLILLLLMILVLSLCVYGNSIAMMGGGCSQGNGGGMGQGGGMMGNGGGMGNGMGQGMGGGMGHQPLPDNRTGSDMGNGSHLH
ncbi:hypothetical protein [Candidatus Magnetomonas plexicatena]|uniref:hypothetical protein n=1 Tax=Candidatus Magnetomonas plexicatena TaxID=2552947 RepID=UPI001C797908|nr:hypothetical protein E2O03_005030 [Nitrospirales bacterium LBB_01]